MLTFGCSPLVTPNIVVILVVAPIVALALVVVVALVRAVIGSRRQFGGFAGVVVMG